MKYDLGIINEKQDAISYFNKLIDCKARIDIKERKNKRSLSQNKYLHVLFSIYGLESGYALDEAKDVIKAELKYTYIKNDKMFFKKTSKMDSKQLTEFIEKFKKLAALEGIHLPSPNQINDTLLNYIESNKIWL